MFHIGTNYVWSTGFGVWIGLTTKLHTPMLPPKHHENGSHVWAFTEPTMSPCDITTDGVVHCMYFFDWHAPVRLLGLVVYGFMLCALLRRDFPESATPRPHWPPGDPILTKMCARAAPHVYLGGEKPGQSRSTGESVGCCVTCGVFLVF